MPPKASGGGKKTKAAKSVTNKRRRGFVDVDLRVSKKQERKDDEKFVKAKFGNFEPAKRGGGRNKDGGDSDDSENSDSDSDAEKAMGAKPPRARTHVFKNFATRVGEVDLDVHRTAGALRTDPLEGSSSFFHETLLKCAELNCGAHFSEMKRETEPLCQSLPMLVLHQDKVLGCILSKLIPEAKHSLEAVLRCLQALARDLRSDFVTRSFGSSVDGIAQLLKTDVAREPELLEFTFQALAFMCKWCQRQLVLDLPGALQMTKPLREHPQAHVRVFAAQAVAFLLRAAPDASVGDGINALFVEATRDCGDGDKKQKEQEANLHGAGVLLAEAVKGAGKGLHSRAERVLKAAFRPRRLFLRDAEEKKKNHDVYPSNREASTSYLADSWDARSARASKIAEHAVAALCKHTRRGKCAEMWRLVLGAARKAAKETRALDSRTSREDVHWESSDSESDADETATTKHAVRSGGFRVRSVARACDVAAVAVETYKGARVENYGLLFDAAKNDILPALARASAESSNQNSVVGVTTSDVSLLASATHRLLLSLVDAHNIVAGASVGPAGVGAAAKDWSIAVTASPPDVSFAFLQHLRNRAITGNSEAALHVLRALLPQASATLVGLIDEGWDISGDEKVNGENWSSVTADAAAALLGDTCDALLGRNGGVDNDGMPIDTLLCAASRETADAIVNRCRHETAAPKSKTKKASAKKNGQTPKPPPASRRWALLRLVPHCDFGCNAWHATRDAAVWGLNVLESETNDGYAMSDDSKTTKAVLAAALASRAVLHEKSKMHIGPKGTETTHGTTETETTHTRTKSSVQFALRGVHVAFDCPGIVLASADVLKACFADDPEGTRHATGDFFSKKNGTMALDLSTETDRTPLFVVANMVAKNLEHPSRHLRHATLLFLCELSRTVGESEFVCVDTVSPGATPSSLGELFALFANINARDASDVTKTGVMEYAKSCQVSIASAARCVASGDKEFNPEWAAPLELCALGATRLRLSTLWPPLITLLAALASKSGLDDARVVLHEGLAEAQNECLRTHDGATNAAKTTTAALKTHGRRRGWIEVAEVAGKEDDADEDGEDDDGDVDDDDENKPVDDDASPKPRNPETEPQRNVLRAKAVAENFPDEQGVERWTRFCTLLKCVASAPAFAARNPKQIAELFLLYDAPREDGTLRAGKAFRNGLREWLRLFKDALGGGRAVRALEGGVGDAVRRSLEKHVSADESDVAQLSITCLGMWRLPHLSVENAARLCRVADEKTMKHELINLHLGREDAGGHNGETETRDALGGAPPAVTKEHRPAFASLVVKALLPRLKKRSGRHAPLRAAALAWIGNLEPHEIAPLVHAVIAPLEGSERAKLSVGEDSWEVLVAKTGAGNNSVKFGWQKAARDANVGHLVSTGSKRPEGFLRAAHDLLKAAGTHVGFYLDALLSLTTELLTAASAICEAAADARSAEDSGVTQEKHDGTDCNIAPRGVSPRASKEAKDVRAAATRFLASVFTRHPGFDYARYWPAIANALAPMAKRAAAESSSANAAPPAVALIAAIAGDDRCARFLMGGFDTGGTAAVDTVDPGGTTVDTTGTLIVDFSSVNVTNSAGSFLSDVWDALGTPRASGQARAAALAVAESLVERAEIWRLEHSDDQLERMGDGVAAELLRAHAPALLDALRGALAARASKGGPPLTMAKKEPVACDEQTAQDAETPKEHETGSGEKKEDDSTPKDESTDKPGNTKPGKKKLAKVDKKRGAAVLAAGAAGRELEILKRLGPLLGRAAASAAVADVLVPVLGVKRLDEQAATEVLHAFAAVAPRPDLGKDDQETIASMKQSAAKHAVALAPLFGRLRTRGARRALCNAFGAIGAWDHGACQASLVLSRLHSESKESIDGIDYEKRLDAYDSLNLTWFAKTPPQSSTPIAHHLLHELRGKDMALRHAAAAALGRMLDAAVAAKEVSFGAKGGADDGGTGNDKVSPGNGAVAGTVTSNRTDGTGASVDGVYKSNGTDDDHLLKHTHGDVVMRVIAPGIRGLLRAPDMTTRAEAIAAFRKLAKTWPEAAPGAYALLADDSDPEKDFFFNAAHLQAHRRARALRRLSSAAAKTKETNELLVENAGDGVGLDDQEMPAQNDLYDDRAGGVANLLPAETIVGYLAPLATAALGDPGADVASTAAAAVGALAGALPWGPYRDLLHATLRKATAGRGGLGGRGYDVEGSKALHIRAAATILEQFHEFDVFGEDAVEIETGHPAVATNVVGRLLHPDVVASLRLDVLPKLEQLAVVEDNEGKGGTVRPAAAAAMVAVLRLLPARDLDADISRVLGKMANCLRSRAQGVRDSARAALASASAGLGAAHLPSIVSLLTTRLDRGFMIHVLGATLFTILDATVTPDSDPEDVEDALREIIPVLDADVFGRAAQEREEVAAIRGAYTEAKRSRAFECLTLLAEHGAMPDCLPALLAPVTKRLAFAANQGLRTKLELYLQAVMRGVLKNKHASTEQTLVLCYSVINDGVTRDEAVKQQEASQTLEENTLGEQKRGVKEFGNRVWENGWYLIKLPAPGSDKFVVEETGLKAGDRYKKAKYGEAGDEGGTGKQSEGNKAPNGIAALAGATNDVPPNFEILVVFALSLLRSLLRKMSGEKGVGGKARGEEAEVGVEGGEEGAEAYEDDAVAEGDDDSKKSKKIIAGLSKRRVQILEGVVPLMARALSSPHGPVIPLATRCLAQLSTMKLSAFDNATGALARRVMALLRECPRASDPLAQDCAKLLNNLLKRHARFTPTEAQFRFLVTFCFGDLEADQREGHRSTTFALLRAILARRPLLPEVYDVMKTVSSLIVRAGATETRGLCSQALVQFLLDYPLGERRLRQHIDALCANLEYQYASGRLSALRTIKDIVNKFPTEVVVQHAPFLFVPLVARLGADEDGPCRAGAGDALRALLLRVANDPGGTITKLLSLCVGWLAAGSGDTHSPTNDPRLRVAAMQTLGLACVSAPGPAAVATRAARRRIVESLTQHDPQIGTSTNAPPGDDDDTVCGWQTVYHALLLVEKMASSCPGSLTAVTKIDNAYVALLRGESSSRSALDRDDDDALDGDPLDHPDAPWRAAQQLLTHRHQWVQLAAARVVGRYLAENGGALAAETIARDEDAINRRPIQVDTVARGCVAVLEQSTGQFAVELVEGLVTQTVKNLTFVTVVLMKAAPSDHDSLVALRRENESNRGREAREAEDADDDDERDEKGDASTKTHDDVNKPFKEKTLRPPVPWLFRRLSKVGAGGCGSARGGVLKWTSLLARSLGETGFTRNPSVAPALVLPNALCADENVSGIGDDIRELAAEALEVLRATMPGDLFSRAASETRVRINQRRDERRKRKALEAVTDPQRAARMKTSKNEKRSLARKRKIQEFRSGKGSGGSTKKRAREV